MEDIDKNTEELELIKSNEAQDAVANDMDGATDQAEQTNPLLAGLEVEDASSSSQEDSSTASEADANADTEANAKGTDADAEDKSAATASNDEDGQTVATINLSADDESEDNQETKSLLELADDVDVMSLSDLEVQRFPTREENHDGFRLQRVDVYNWGSFNNNVKSVYFGGQNVLMTGDNGAGKSSIIDAMTVLLYDVKKVVFNQAAGAEKGERNLASYVLGYYKNDNSSGVKTELGLRSRQNAVLSIIMASFYNRKLDEHVVLIQCLVMLKQKSTPDRYYFIGNQDFNLQKDILPVKDVRELGQKLRAIGAVNYKSFTDYYAQMQRLFGIEGTKVLDLFYKTISMKSISNISDFVRKQMLEDFNGDELVEQMVDRFNDLDASYKSVEEARKQVEALEPIVIKGEEYKTVQTRIGYLEQCSNNIQPYLYKRKSELLKVDIDKNEARLNELNAELTRTRESLDGVNLKIVSISDEIAANGGDRTKILEQNILNAKRERDRVFSNYVQHANMLRNIELDPVEDERSFTSLYPKLETMKETYKSSIENYDDNVANNIGLMKDAQSKRDEVKAELDSLRDRKNNIPLNSINLRQSIADYVGCKEEELPFAGELMQVRAEEKRTWEFAIEKVLHGFATSMLVPEEHYSRVVSFVNNNDLGMRLVFFRIKDNEFTNNQFSNNLGSQLSNFNRPKITSACLPRKVEIKNDPTFHGFIKDYLERNFNYVCTEDEAEYRQERMALTPSGLSKKGGRNEKDDRKSRKGNNYVLGWSNEEKINMCLSEYQKYSSEVARLEEAIKNLRRGRDTSNNRLLVLSKLLDIKQFTTIDYKFHDKEIEKLNEELEEVKRSSDILSTLHKRRDMLYQDRKVLEERRDNYTREQGTLDGRNQDLLREYHHAEELSQVIESLTPDLISAIERLVQSEMTRNRIVELTYDRVDRLISDIGRRLKEEIDTKRAEQSRMAQELVNLQSNFTQTFVVAGRNLDASRAQAWEDFKTFLDKLQQDDLPRFVSAFKDKLNRETIDQLGTLNASLLAQSRKIRDRIAELNVIMKEVNFNENSYIQMVANESIDQEIKQFRLDLKDCTSNILDSEWTLEDADRRFHEVKKLIDRFKGEVNGADIDGRWRRKVTDVKMWFEFSASEHSREDDSQVDYYEDSGGKSGGQKEKLAYTVLASSLAYQYQSKARRLGYNVVANEIDNADATDTVSLDEAQAQNGEVSETEMSGQINYSPIDRSYRFVIIDEAFGRGSPQSVDYALTLFGKFNLQLLIATPMQKLDIIEKFVNHVAFVYRDEASHESTVINYGLHDYILKRRLKEQIARAPLMAGRVHDNSDSVAALSSEKAQQLYDKLDKQILEQQDNYSGPRAQVVAEPKKKPKSRLDTQAGVVVGYSQDEAEAKLNQSNDEKYSSLIDAINEQNADKDATAEGYGKTHMVSGGAATEKGDGDEQDSSDIKLEGKANEAQSEVQDDGVDRDKIAQDYSLKDENGNYIDAKTYTSKLQEERKKQEEQRTQEALSKLDFLEDFFASAEDEAEAQTEDSIDYAQGDDGSIMAEESDLMTALKESSDVDESPFNLEPQSAPKSKSKKKSQEDEEPQYSHSLDDLLVMEDDDEEDDIL